MNKKKLSIAKMLGYKEELDIANIDSDYPECNTMEEVMPILMRYFSKCPRWEWYKVQFKGKYYQLYADGSFQDIGKSQVEKILRNEKGELIRPNDLNFLSDLVLQFKVICHIKNLGYRFFLISNEDGTTVAFTDDSTSTQKHNYHLGNLFVEVKENMIEKAIFEGLYQMSLIINKEDEKN